MPVGHRPARPRRRSARPAARRRRRRSTRERYDPIERPAPAIIDRDLVTEPVQTGLLVIDAHVRARARPARADHRRPRHRQDRDRRRHHHQPEAQRHDLRLCRGRAEIVDRRAGDRRGAQRMARRSAASSSSPSAVGRAGPAMDRAVRRLHHGGIFPRPRPARAGGHRRSDQARRDPSRDRAADAPAAGPRGLSGRRLLCACAAAGARREARRQSAAAAR